MNEVVNFPTSRTGRFIISKEKNYCETRSQICFDKTMNDGIDKK